jgi:hypothetical protein
MPLMLTESQLATIEDVAKHVPPGLRYGYHQRVAELLHGQEIGDGSTHGSQGSE